ncbi:MAG: hypothetical protein A4S09_00190 [Proteobacteria bacterium SG_bin7]|nr:MAG: hypothetical protein A4S09_00190 [Proteobacteria bacterium SG_bin7]
MKKSMAIIVSGILTVQSVGYTQQIIPTVTPVGGTTGFLTAGKYDVNKIEANYTEVLKQIVQDNAIKQQADRDFLASKGKIIGDSLRELILRKQAFDALSQKANTTKNVTLEEYLVQVNEINATIEKAKIDIQEASMISAETLPSAVAELGGVQVKMAPGSVIDMTKAISPFQQTLADLETKLNATKFSSLAHKGAFPGIIGNALNPDLSKFPKMDGEEITKALEEIQAKSVVSDSTKKLQQFLADNIVRSVKKYIQLAGTDEFLRDRNQNDLNAMAEEYKTIEKFFFMRSYLRKKYGLQIGAIQSTAYPLDYGKLEGILRKDMIFPMTTALEKIISQVARTDEDLMTAFGNARRFVEFYDRRLTPILSENASAKRAAIRAEAEKNNRNLAEAGLWEKIKAKADVAYQQAVATFANGHEIQAKKPTYLDENGKDMAYNAPDTGLMARLSGMITTATFQGSTVEALLAVMRLILADVREEVMLSQGDWGSLKSYHAQRFMASPEQTVRTVKTICDVDIRLSDAARAAAKALTNDKVPCVKPPTGGLSALSSGDVILTPFRNLMTAYETKEMKRAQDARNLRDLVDMSLNAQSNDGDRVNDAAVFE